MAKILLYERVTDAWFEDFAGFLREREPEGMELELAQPEDAELGSLFALLPEADVLVVGLTGQRRAVVRRVLEDAVRLKLIQKLGSRLFGLDIGAANDAGVPVSLLPVPAHAACAEHTLLLILALAKKLLPAHRQVVKGQPGQTGRETRPDAADDYAYNWAEMEGIGLLHGKTLGLIGAGDIAIEVARRARAFGMDLLYHDERALTEAEEQSLGLERRELEDLLREADVVSLHVALTPQTEELLGAERLALMKPTALLINTARGGLVDEEALADALRNGALAGAGLDAWSTEPPPKTHPLLKLEQVVATPHIASGVLPPTSAFEAIVPNILAALTGGPVAGLVTRAPLDDQTARQPFEADEESDEAPEADAEPQDDQDAAEEEGRDEGEPSAEGEED